MIIIIKLAMVTMETGVDFLMFTMAQIPDTENLELHGKDTEEFLAQIQLMFCTQKSENENKY